ncbi:MAG: hypothetical protein HY272_02570 [Gammaproteobacteria bacterium]|nr:hypothetical protein [Gammaproteobacteria bacterium]
MSSLYSFIVEAVVVSFCMGGAIGAVVTMQLQVRSKQNVEQNDIADGELQVVRRRISK